MAIQRGPIRYGITVDGAVRAADEIGKVDKAADGARDSLRGSGKAAVQAGRDYATAEAEARSLGARFDDVNERAAQFGGRFGDVRSRLGEVEDALLVLSGVAFVQLGQAIYEGIQTVYGWTEAGKEAEREAEALAASFDDIKGSLDRLTSTGVIEALDPATYARLGAAIATTKEEEAEYTEAIQKTVEAQLRVNKARADYERVKADPASARFGEGIHQEAKELGIYERALEGARVEVEKLRASLGEKRAAEQKVREEAEKGRREQENQIRTAKVLTDSIVAQARALPAVIAGWADYHMAVARGRDGAPGVLESVVDWHARLAVAVVDTADKVGKSIDKHRKQGSAAGDTAAEIRRLNDQLDRLTAIDLDGLPDFDFGEIVGPEPIDVDALTAGLLDAEREASFESTRMALERRRVAAEAAEAAQLAAEATAASISGVTAAYIEVQQAQREGMDTTAAWANTVKAAVNEVAMALGAVRAAFDAITEAELISLRNAQQAADEDLRSAVAAERRAKAEADANKSSVSARAAAAKAAQTREAAEEKAYQAALAAAKAEEEAAAARQVFAALDMAAKGVESAADAVRAGALASFLAALPFGAGAPFVPAAIASAVLYGTAAVAYGVGAVATAAAPTPRSGRPERPESTLPEGSARDTVSAGDRERGRDDRPNVYVRFGSVIGTTPEAEDVIVRAIDRAGQRRGGARADYDRSYRRS
ncbi:MAG: hypothetical protein H6705_16760 [Myxococcales bacterium]|nr:hypothetical protein [Myxococcales bacterium]